MWGWRRQALRGGSTLEQIRSTCGPYSYQTSFLPESLYEPPLTGRKRYSQWLPPSESSSGPPGTLGQLKKALAAACVVGVVSQGTEVV